MTALRPRLLALLALAGLGLSVWAALPEGAASTSARVIRVETALPAWTAPGGRLVLRGWAGSGELVALRAGARILARTRGGAVGGFVLRARAPGPGRHRLTIAAGGERLRLGALRVRALRLAAVGDVTFGDGVATAIARHGARYPWLSVAPVLRSADIAVANLEGAVSTRGYPVAGKEFHFRGPPAALAAAARSAGIDVVSLANNHSLDYGRTAFLDTLRHARRFGIATMGGGRSLEAARRPAVLQAGGLSVAFLGFSDVRPAGFDAGPSRSGATPAFPDLIRHDVGAAKARSDVVVAYFHWGVERMFAPTARQRELARIAFDAGATVVQPRLQ